MKVMVMVKATEDSEAGVMPTQAMLEAMGKFNEELVDAGRCWPARACVRVRPAVRGDVLWQLGRRDEARRRSNRPRH